MIAGLDDWIKFLGTELTLNAYAILLGSTDLFLKPEGVFLLDLDCLGRQRMEL